MDRRRSEYESYRPGGYNSNRDARDNESNSRFQSGRPGFPPRTNSHYSHASKPFRSPNDTPSHSPHSPQTNHGEGSTTTNTNQASASKDPRKTRDPEPSTSEKSNLTLRESTPMDLFRELAKQASYEDKVQEAEKKLKVTKEEAGVLRAKFSDNNPLTDQCAKLLKRDEDALSSCLQLLAESKDRSEKILANLPSKTKDLFSGVISTPKEPPLREELDDVKSAVGNLQKKVESLIKQNREQETELKQLRERNIRPPSEPLEDKLTSKITSSQRDTHLKFATFDEKVQKYGESLRLCEQIINELKVDQQKQTSEIKSLTSKHNGVTAPLASLQKRVEKLETHNSEKVLRETPRSPPREDIDDEIAEIQTQQKEQKRQIANLSNMFVSRQEYSDGFLQLETSNKSLGKSFQDTDVSHQALSSRIPVLENKADQLANDIDQIKTTVKELAAPDSRTLHERIDHLSKSTEKMQQYIDNLSKPDTKQIPAQTSVHHAEAISKLQDEVKKLSNFSGHYTTFYEKTQDELKQFNQQLASHNNRMSQIKNNLEARLKSVSDDCQKSQKAIDEFDKRHKAQDGEHAQAINDLHKRVNECDVNATSAFAQNAAVVTDVQALKVSIEQVCHSIQSLDTRYSAISTQKLYHSIVATIQPLLPRIYELTDQLQSMRNTVAVSEQRATLINDKIKYIEADRIEITAKVHALEDRNRGPLATSVPQNVTPQQDGGSLQQGQSSSIQENNAVRDEITGLRNHHDGYTNQLQVLQDKLTIIDQALKDQQKEAGDKAPSLQDLTQLIAELKQSNAEIGPKVMDELNEIRATLKKIRSDMTTFEKIMDEESKLVDKLRTDIEIVDDLQSRIQTVRTDVTAHQERLAITEMGLSQVQDVKQQLIQLQSNFEANQPKETINASGVEETELRQRMDRIEQLLYFVFPAEDRYVVCDNLASTMTNVEICNRFADCTIKEILFGGGKDPATSKTTRYAIVWIASSTEVDAAIQKVTSVQNSKWGGRTPVIRKVSREIFKMLWMEKPHSTRDLIPDVQASSNGRASEVASTPGPFRGMSTDENTTLVSRSSVLPRQTPTHQDVTELPDSDGEDLLDKFGATRDGKPSKRQASERAGSTKASTPSIRGVAKRGAPDSGSSRPSSKRGRRG